MRASSASRLGDAPLRPARMLTTSRVAPQRGARILPLSRWRPSSVNERSPREYTDRILRARHTRHACCSTSHGAGGMVPPLTAGFTACCFMSHALGEDPATPLPRPRCAWRREHCAAFGSSRGVRCYGREIAPPTAVPAPGSLPKARVLAPAGWSPCRRASSFFLVHGRPRM